MSTSSKSRPTLTSMYEIILELVNRCLKERRRPSPREIEFLKIRVREFIEGRYAILQVTLSNYEATCSRSVEEIKQEVYNRPSVKKLLNYVERLERIKDSQDYLQELEGIKLEIELEIEDLKRKFTKIGFKKYQELVKKINELSAENEFLKNEILHRDVIIYKLEREKTKLKKELDEIRKELNIVKSSIDVYRVATLEGTLRKAFEIIEFLYNKLVELEKENKRLKIQVEEAQKLINKIRKDYPSIFKKILTEVKFEVLKIFIPIPW